MAKNQKFDVPILVAAASHPTTPKSGNPVRVGTLTGVALKDENADGNTVIDFRLAVYEMSVKGVNDAGNSAVAVGDQLFYVDADVGAGTGFLSKKDSGYFFGIALGAVSSGATANINVLCIAGPGPGELDIGEIITANELAASVAGAGLAGGAGAALSVNVDDVGIEIPVDTLQLKDLGVTTAKLADDGVTKAKLAGGFLKGTAIAGGAAGAHTVTGIATGDELVLVARLDLDGTAANIDLDDLTSEFTISAADTINNAAGTDTTGDKLLVLYLDLT